MTARRRPGYALDIPFVDDSSGNMVNGVRIGRPATPPIVRITVPVSETMHPPVRPGSRDDLNSGPSSYRISLPFLDDNHRQNSATSLSTPIKSTTEAESGSGNSDSRRGSNEGDDQPGELKSSTNAPLHARHRRSSISLPVDLDNLDIQVIPDEARSDEESASDVDDSECNTDVEETKIPLRSARKKSIMPHRAPDLDALDLSDASPVNSITSVNSIASLLKEKLSMMALPGLLKNKRKPKNYKLKSFVAFLFLCIVFLVSFAYVFYHQQVLQRAYFERIRFNNEEKVVRVYGNEGEELLTGVLGTTLNSDLVFKCLKHDIYNDGSVCMEWMHRARLYLRYNKPSPGVRCYQITWMSLNPGTHPTDCFDWSLGGHWYGGGQARNMTWPAELGVVQNSPFITGDITQQEWGNVLQRYFLNSKGVAISIDPATPLRVSIDTVNDRKQFCIQAQHDDFAYFYKNSPLPQLNYSICVSSNITVLHGFLSEKSLWDGLKAEDIDTVNSLLTEPVWQIGAERPELINEYSVSNYTEDVITFGFLKQGHVLLNEMWQKNIGDFTLDEERFPTMANTIKILQRRGFKVVLSIQPFISTESANFKIAVREKLLVAVRGTDHIPALTRYKGVESAGVLDITNNNTIPWLQQKLRAVTAKYNINSFYLDLGSAYNMPHYYKFDHNLVNIDEYKTLFTEAVLQHVEVIGVSSAVARPRPPVFVSAPPLASSWQSLSLIIPTVLTYGIIGYPFIMPGPVGGDFFTEPTLANYTHMYLKSVENALFKKSMENLFPTPSMNKTNPLNKNAIKKDQAVTEATVINVVEADNESVEVLSPMPPQSKNTEQTHVTGTKDDIQLLENIFSKDVNGADAEEILRNISQSNISDVLDKAMKDFPGDAVLGEELRFLPDKELYIRWLQLATFLPVIRFTYLPNKYKDESVLEMAKFLTTLRVKTVNPLLKKYAREALDSGLPIIRPLWMLDPGDPTCHTVVDEFSVGEELIVAPVIHEATTEREVYLPAGVWQDGIDGSLRKGSRWIHKYRVPQNKVAYFLKMPDNTRF